MGIAQSRKIASRERRLGTVSHYNDVVNNFKEELLADEPKQRIRTFSQATYDEVIYALSVLAGVKNSAVVLHGAAGCLSSGIYFRRNRWELNWYTTDLNERDTILGGTDKLYDTVMRAYEETGAEIIFIVGSPVIAINNDDISAVVAELGFETDAKLVPVYTDAFQSKAAVNGYDIVLHSLLRYVIEPDDTEKKNFVNVVAVSENDENLSVIADILSYLGVSFQFVPVYADINAIKRSAQASLTIVLNKSEGSVFAEGLKEKWDVPYITPKIPIGFKDTCAFITAVSKALGISQKGDKLIKEYSDKIKGILYKNSLKGKRIFLNLNIEKVKSFIDFIKELNGEISGICVPFADFECQGAIRELEHTADRTPFIIASGQPFELTNVLNKVNPDIYISESSDFSFMNIDGIAALNLNELCYYGFDGIINLADLFNKTYLVRNAKVDCYKSSWLKKSSNWYVKQEVM